MPSLLSKVAVSCSTSVATPQPNSGYHTALWTTAGQVWLLDEPQNLWKQKLPKNNNIINNNNNNARLTSLALGHFTKISWVAVYRLNIQVRPRVGISEVCQCEMEHKTNSGRLLSACLCPCGPSLKAPLFSTRTVCVNYYPNWEASGRCAVSVHAAGKKKRFTSSFTRL